MSFLQNLASGISEGIQNFANHSAKAAATANAISGSAQGAQASFNEGQAAIANGLGSARLEDQYAFNSAQAQAANDFTQMMWNQSAAYNDAAWERAAAWNEAMWQKSADWNEMMAQRQMDFNSKEALKNRQWQQKMANTSYQRAVADMKKAGINPILASGGVSVGAGGGSAASIGGYNMSPSYMGGSSMNPMSGQGASGSVLNGEQASINNYTGQMEYMGGLLGVLGAAIDGINTAIKYSDGDRSIAEMLMGMLGEMTKEQFNNPNTWYNRQKRGIENSKKAAQYYIDKGLHPKKYNKE